MIELTSILHFSILLDWILSWAFMLLLFLVKVPRSEYSEKLRVTKRTITLCYFVCGVLFGLTYIFPNVPDYEVYATSMMLIVTMVSASSLSYSLTNLINRGQRTHHNLVVSIFVITILGLLLAYTSIKGPHTVRNLILISCVIWQLLQCASHVLSFGHIFNESQKKLENYYDEEEDLKLYWIRFCYAVMMVIELIMLICVYLPHKVLFIYLFVYAVFIVYFVSSFLSFLASHKPLLDAFADTDSIYSNKKMEQYPFNVRFRLWLRRRKAANKKKDVKKSLPNTRPIKSNSKEMDKIVRNLDKWVLQKKYLEYDKSRQEIADELGTTREYLQMYFLNVKGEDFRTWRTSLRIHDAMNLLLEDKALPINLVGEKCGFSDRSNFHTQFTKIVGCSPRVWRETNGQPTK